MSIHTLSEKIKSKAGERKVFLVTLLALVLCSTVSFWLGYSAKREIAHASPVVIQCPVAAYMPKNTAIAGQGGSNGVPALSASAITASTTATQKKSSGAFVASKNGTKYYPLNCSGVKRIKEENKVFFTTAKEAESAGYGPAANCNY
jgi:hypothetical protein